MSYIGNTPGVSSQRVVTEEVLVATKSDFYPVGGYSLGYVDVLVNGHEVDSSDFTATDGVKVSLLVAAVAGDTVKIKAWLPRGLSDGYLKSEADALLAGKLSNSAGAVVANLGFTPQQADALLTALSGLTTSANQLPYFTGADAIALTDLSAFIRTLLDDADAATARGTLGLGALATVSPSGSGNSSTFLRGDGSWQTPVAGLTQISYSQAGSGYLRLSNGFMIQWGITAYIADYGRAFQAFPTSFPNAAFSVVTQNVDSEDANWMDNLRVYDINVSGFTMFRRGNNSRNWFIAIGY